MSNVRPQVRTLEEAKAKVLDELKGAEDDEHRKEFWSRYEAQINEFVDAMCEGYVKLHDVEPLIAGDEGRGVVVSLAYASLSLHLVSMKLFVSGHIIAAGALFRQVLEAIALALLTSKKDLGIRERFVNHCYSSNDAVNNLVRQSKKLGLNADAVKRVLQAQNFYHKYSHVSPFTIAAMTPFEEQGLYVGAAFDKGKLDAYQKEADGRASLAKVLPNVIEVVEMHLKNEAV